MRGAGNSASFFYLNIMGLQVYILPNGAGIFHYLHGEGDGIRAKNNEISGIAFVI